MAKPYVFIPKSIIEEENIIICKDVFHKPFRFYSPDTKTFSKQGMLILADDLPQVVRKYINIDNTSIDYIKQILPLKKVMVMTTAEILPTVQPQLFNFLDNIKHIIEEVVYKSTKKQIMLWTTNPRRYDIHSDISTIWQNEKDNENIIHIICYSSLSHIIGEGHTSLLPQIFEYSLRGGETRSYNPSFGYKIKDANGIIPAEYYKNKLCILFNVLSMQDNISSTIFKTILEHFIDHINNGNKEEHLESIKNLSRTSMNKRTRVINENINRLSDEYANYASMAKSKAIELGERRLEVELLSKIDIDAVQNNIKQLQEIDGVEYFYVTKESVYPNLVVITDNIEIRSVNIRNEPTIYSMGQYMILICLEDTYLRVLPFQNNYKVIRNDGDNGIYHPYINTTHDMCFGDLSQEVYMRLGRLDYYTAITMIIQTLKDFCPQVSPHGAIYLWKEVGRSV